MNKQLANIVFQFLLAISLFITWKSVGYAGDLAYSGGQPILWLNFVAFGISVGLVGIAIYVKTKYGK